MVSAVRGATTVNKDCKEQVIDRVIEMVDALFKDNDLIDKSVISIHFSITEDIVSLNPAAALRSKGGYADIPLFCASEPKSIGALEKAIRVLITWNGEVDKKKPCYLHGATVLRPDLVNLG